MSAREQERKRFFELVERLARSRDPEEQGRLKEELAHMTFGELRRRSSGSGLPPALRDHLFERLRERKITVDDLYRLKAWREPEPEAPEGLWHKDFGSFKIRGEGKYPKTFLLRGQPPKGQKL